MSERPIRLAIISDTNCEMLAHYFRALYPSSQFEVTTSPFGQALPILLNSDHNFWTTNFDHALVITQPELISENVSQQSHSAVPLTERLHAEVKTFTDALSEIRRKVPSLFVTNWFTPLWKHNYFATDFKSGGCSNTITKMNFFLMNELENIEGCFLLDSQRWLATHPTSLFSTKLWYSTKQLYSNGYFKLLASDLISTLQGLNGQSRKLIILDLDDTLWGGTLGDCGWKNLRLGGHDPIGEAFVDFQLALKRLKNSGVLLAISSKNNEATALEAIKQHPEMVLKIEDFVGWKINWKDKSQNIRELLTELNLGAQSAVFIDNSPVERNRVSTEMPEILVPNWPSDEADYLKALTSLSCFDKPFLTNEDITRTDMMNQEANRSHLKSSAGSFEKWLESLKIKCSVEELSEANFQRVVQLFNKTNQMNLSTRRLSPDQLSEWCAKTENKIYTIRVEDKFGDYGLTGIIGIRKNKNQIIIEDYILSCRVMGRKVEETMLSVIYSISKQSQCEQIIAKYLKTEKNQPCYQFFKNSGFNESAENGVFTWETDKNYPVPGPIELEWKDHNDKA